MKIDDVYSYLLYTKNVVLSVDAVSDLACLLAYLSIYDPIKKEQGQSMLTQQGRERKEEKLNNDILENLFFSSRT